MARPARIDENGMVETGFEEKRTCGDCPWGQLMVDGEITECMLGQMSLKEPECLYRRQYRVVRDEVRRLRARFKAQEFLDTFAIAELRQAVDSIEQRMIVRRREMKARE